MIEGQQLPQPLRGEEMIMRILNNNNKQTEFEKEKAKNALGFLRRCIELRGGESYLLCSKDAFESKDEYEDFVDFLNQNNYARKNSKTAVVKLTSCLSEIYNNVLQKFQISTKEKLVLPGLNQTHLKIRERAKRKRLEPLVDSLDFNFKDEQYKYTEKKDPLLLLTRICCETEIESIVDEEDSEEEEVKNSPAPRFDRTVVEADAYMSAEDSEEELTDSEEEEPEDREIEEVLDSGMTKFPRFAPKETPTAFEVPPMMPRKRKIQPPVIPQPQPRTFYPPQTTQQPLQQQQQPPQQLPQTVQNIPMPQPIPLRHAHLPQIPQNMQVPQTMHQMPQNVGIPQNVAIARNLGLLQNIGIPQNVAIAQNIEGVCYGAPPSYYIPRNTPLFYGPPRKLQKIGYDDDAKRRRRVTTEEEKEYLKMMYRENPYPTREQYEAMRIHLGWKERKRITKWFNNERYNTKSKER